jgi:predicted cupin superfamily sugar epimerase
MSEAHLASASDWIEWLRLEPHPEGGWYREWHRSSLGVRRDADGASRSGLTLIAYLLEAGAISRWHRVRGGDEIWQYGAGASLRLWRLPPGGGEAEALILGPWQIGASDQAPAHVIPAGCWQAAHSLGPWSLVTCCVGPGFDFADFDLLREQPGGPDLAGALHQWL